MRYGIDYLLTRWAEAIQAEIDSSAYSKTTTIYRLMRLGPEGASIKGTTINLPNYWPDPDVRAVNEVVWGMPVEYRNAIVLAYILRCSTYEAGKEQGITREQARYRLRLATNYVNNHLTSTVSNLY